MPCYIGWWDNSFEWTALYDKVEQCGSAKGPATYTNTSGAGMIFSRIFDHCSVKLDCTADDPKTKGAKTCKGEIQWPF